MSNCPNINIHIMYIECRRAVILVCLFIILDKIKEILLFTFAYKNKSGAVRSGDSEGQATSSFLDITYCGLAVIPL